MAIRVMNDNIPFSKFCFACINLIPEFRDAVRGCPKMSVENSPASGMTEAAFNNINWQTGTDPENGTATFGPCPHAELVWADIQTEMDRLQAEYDGKEYQRNRKNEYPMYQELVVALYDTDDKAAIETKRAAIKLKYPKP